MTWTLFEKIEDFTPATLRKKGLLRLFFLCDTFKNSNFVQPQ